MTQKECRMTSTLIMKWVLKTFVILFLLSVLGVIGWIAKDVLTPSQSSIVTKNNWDVCSTTSECDTVVKPNYGHIAINRNFIDLFLNEQTPINIGGIDVVLVESKSYCGVNPTARCVFGRCRILSSIDTLSYLRTRICY